jgi:hypothetical protein
MDVGEAGRESDFVEFATPLVAVGIGIGAVVVCAAYFESIIPSAIAFSLGVLVLGRYVYRECVPTRRVGYVGDDTISTYSRITADREVVNIYANDRF